MWPVWSGGRYIDVPAIPSSTVCVYVCVCVCVCVCVYIYIYLFIYLFIYLGKGGGGDTNKIWVVVCDFTNDRYFNQKKPNFFFTLQGK